MFDKLEFTVTKDHLKLLRRMQVSWNDCEYGAPEIDPKRPYGNSYVTGDIAEILGWTLPEQHLFEYDKLMEVISIAARQIHREMETVLQIFIDNFGITTGIYSKEQYSSEAWKLITEEKGGI